MPPGEEAESDRDATKHISLRNRRVEPDSDATPAAVVKKLQVINPSITWFPPL